jgi:hypothetical protein
LVGSGLRVLGSLRDGERLALMSTVLAAFLALVLLVSVDFLLERLHVGLESLVLLLEIFDFGREVFWRESWLTMGKNSVVICSRIVLVCCSTLIVGR